MATVIRWTGREVRALRHAKRMSLRAFAAHLGVSERMVSKWEAGGENIVPRPVNQAALDTSLAASATDVHERFATLLTSREPSEPRQPNGGDTYPTPTAAIERHARHRTDGKLMVYVEEGFFLTGEDSESMWLPGFWIDVFPITNAEYARFAAATGHPLPRHWPGGRCPDEVFDHPVVWVTWRDAAAYAVWADKSLPTSQQWEKAARGPKGSIYPWGDGRTYAKSNVRESGVGITTPVNRYHSGVSPYGVYDLCGNVWEWLSTETTPGRRELKGSAFTSPFFRAEPAMFNDASIDMSDDDTGFRCVIGVSLKSGTINHPLHEEGKLA